MARITGWDDRSGGPAGPGSFGYVYFSDNSRVGYSPGVEGKPAVWEPRTNGDGRYVPVTPQHLRAAVRFLTRKGVLPPTPDTTRFTETVEKRNTAR